MIPAGCPVRPKTGIAASRRHARGALVLLAVLAGAAGPAYAELAPGSGRFVFVDAAANPGRPVTVWYHRPAGTGADVPVVFVMHGVKRDGERYRDNWVALADADRFLVIVPEFSKKHFPGSRGYNMGNVFRRDGGRRPARAWAFAVIERIFDSLGRDHGLTARRYDIFGHSAGAQFVHRMVLFLPGARIRTAVAANAGWYTMVDPDRAVPYGLAGAGIGRARLRAALARRLIVLLGEADTDLDHRYLRRTPRAMAQGANRLERGRNFFAAARGYARRIGAPFAWRLVTVPGVSHSNRKMARAAARFLGRRAQNWALPAGRPSRTRP